MSLFLSNAVDSFVLLLIQKQEEKTLGWCGELPEAQRYCKRVRGVMVGYMPRKEGLKGARATGWKLRNGWSWKRWR